MDFSGLLFGLIILTISYLKVGPHLLKIALQMIVRMRWFFLSIGIVYFWFTPGEAIFSLSESAVIAWLPTIEGVEQGILHILSLMMIIIAVNLLLRTTERDQLFMAIYILARPFSIIGLSRNRLAIRMVLVLEKLSEVQLIVTESCPDQAESKNSFVRLGNRAADVFHKVIKRADEEPCQTITLPKTSAPHVLQWLYPLMIGLLFFIVL